MQSNYPSDIQSTSKSTQAHRFFERSLPNNLDILTKELLEIYKKIENAELPGVSPVKGDETWKETESVSTMKWREYNVFQFYTEELYDLYRSVSDMTKEACTYYDIDFEKEKFYIQGWFNINYIKKGKIDWHDHSPLGAPNFHGYYSVKAEPSSTYYKVFDKEIENKNVDGRAILSEMGHPHAMADWDWDGPRITIAYDVIPLEILKQITIEKFPATNWPSVLHKQQHWIPLL
jgi:hypothetical protein